MTIKNGMLFLLIMVLSFSAVKRGDCASTGAIVNEAGKMSVLLDSGWRFLFVGDDSSTEYASSFTSDSCAVVTVPHVFPSGRPGAPPLRGYGWYFREVEVPDSMAGRELFLEFEGVCLYADVFVNGIQAYRSAFAYMPFSVDLSRCLNGKDLLRIAVRVDGRLHSGRIPDHEAKGWWVYGGIGREVALTARPLMRIDDLKVRTVFRRRRSFDLHCAVSRLKGREWDSVVVSVIAREEKERLVAQFTMRDTVTTVLVRNVRAWCPEDPFRHELRFTPFFGSIPGATTSMLRGFCQLTARGTRLFLNGKPYYLRGMGRHDLLRLDGYPPTRQERRNDLADMKSLGVNFLRIAHFPQHKDVYELCDSIGLLVMDEIPAWKTDPKFLGSSEGRQYGIEYMRRLIEAHGNYTSVCFWSVGNQLKSYRTSVADYVGATAAAVKEIDPSRLVTFCSYYYFWDKAFSFVDVIAVNEYFGWELASLEMLTPMLDKINREWPKKPVIVSEIGAQAKLGLSNPKARLAGPIRSMLGKDISEDHQALYIGAHMDTIWNRRDFVCGMVIWAYGDYMADLDKKRTPDMPQGINSCGIVTAQRARKLAYDAVKRRYTTWRDLHSGRRTVAR